jgi:hypothetical protein
MPRLVFIKRKFLRYPTIKTFEELIAAIQGGYSENKRKAKCEIFGRYDYYHKYSTPTNRRQLKKWQQNAPDDYYHLALDDGEVSIQETIHKILSKGLRLDARERDDPYPDGVYLSSKILTEFVVWGGALFRVRILDKTKLFPDPGSNVDFPWKDQTTRNKGLYHAQFYVDDIDPKSLTFLRILPRQIPPPEEIKPNMIITKKKLLMPILD